MATDYTTLVTSAYRDQPKFMATVALLTGAVGQISDANMGLTNAFDLDQAVGAQLDVLGLWIGISRNISIPIADAFFTWDDADLGWNMANWKGPFEPTEGITRLDDETYRAVLKAKVASNYWLGTNETLNQIGGSVFLSLGVQCFVIDNFDMSVTIYILGTPTAALIELIKRSITPPKTAGVRIAGYVLASAPGHPFFALDSDTTPTLAGLDFGSFGDPI